MGGQATHLGGRYMTRIFVLEVGVGNVSLIAQVSCMSLDIRWVVLTWLGSDVSLSYRSQMLRSWHNRARMHGRGRLLHVQNELSLRLM